VPLQAQERGWLCHFPCTEQQVTSSKTGEASRRGGRSPLPGTEGGGHLGWKKAAGRVVGVRQSEKN